ncbi:MAG: VWA domain-containing protein [Cohnella sp.]|nr:VWA domain-containing protein [Cohnella sp.]
MSTSPSPSVTCSYAWNRPYLPAGGAGTGTYYLLIEARGKGASAAERAPINVALVLDRSGSMTGKPISYGKRACQFAVDQLGEHDVLSLVAFDDEVRTIVPPVRVSNKVELKRRIERIQTGSCTNLSGGLIEGARHALSSKNAEPNAVNRVIVLSDGHANRGITSKRRLAEIAREYGSSGVGITAMGVGDGFDEDLMDTISDHGGGNFHYIDTPERIPVILQKELEGLLSVVANRMTLTIRQADGAKVTNVFGYAAEARPGELKVNAGDLYGNEAKTILLEVAVSPREPGRHSVLELVWDYTDLADGIKTACSFTCEVHAEFTENGRLLDRQGESKVLEQVELAQSAKAIEAAMEAMDRGDLYSGQRMLRQQADQLRLKSDALDAPMLSEAADKLYGRLDDNFAYDSRMRKELHEQKYKQLRRQ